MIDQASVIILPFLISGIIDNVPGLSIKYGIERTIADGIKIKSLTKVYTVLVFIITFIVTALGVMASYPKSDIFNLFDNKSTYDLVSFVSNTARTQDNYCLMLLLLSLISIITPALFYITGRFENKSKNGNKSTDKQLSTDLIVRILMFSVGALVAWLSLIILLKTPVEILDKTPILLLMEYLIILLCLRINFRFQIKADRDEEKSPNVLGCIPICCSAVWCTFVYAVFGISFLLSFSTFRHINDFIVQQGIYGFWGYDCRSLLIMTSISYVVLFIATNNKGFRGKAWYVFAFYVISVSYMILFPMIAVDGKKTLNAFAVLFVFLFFYFCVSKIRKQTSEHVKKQMESNKTTVNSEKKSFWANVKDKIEPWTILMVVIAVLVVLVAEVVPLVKSYGS